VGITSFTAEADKIYYFDAQLSIIGGSRGTYIPPSPGPNGAATPGRPVGSGGSPGVPSIDFVQLDDDTGKFRVKAWKLATWKAK